MGVPCTFFLFFAVGVVINAEYDIFECDRVRKAWHLTTFNEKQTVITAFQQMATIGKLDYFSKTHHSHTISGQIHGSSSMFPWYRYFTWEFENQVRSIGQEFKCFAMPYWDVSRDASLYESANILNSGIGGNGDVSNMFCVDDDQWDSDAYPTYNICGDKEMESNTGCCLKRTDASTSSDVPSIASFTHTILKNPQYGGSRGFRQEIEAKLHSLAHVFIGGVDPNEITQMMSSYSTDDPAFWLLQSFSDYIWTVWMQCHGYNQIDTANLDQFTDVYEEFPVSDAGFAGLDDVLQFDGMNDAEWFKTNYELFQPTARTMMDNQQWGILYESGTFIGNSKLSDACFNTFDNDIILSNSKETFAMISRTDKTDLDEYSENLWTNWIKPIGQYGDGSSMTLDYYQTWDSKLCHYQRQLSGDSDSDVHPCNVPDDYAKCDVSERELSLDGLLQKEGVSGNDCLETVRKQMYAYAKVFDNVYGLCMGEYDDVIVACDYPKIDILTDMEDEAYYNELKQIYQHKSETMNKQNDNNDLMVIDNVDGLSGDSIKGTKPYYYYMILLFVVVILLGLYGFAVMKKRKEGNMNVSIINEQAAHDVVPSYGSL